MVTKKQQETLVNIVIIVATFYQNLKSTRHVCSSVFQRNVLASPVYHVKGWIKSTVLHFALG